MTWFPVLPTLCVLSPAHYVVLQIPWLQSQFLIVMFNTDRDIQLGHILCVTGRVKIGLVGDWQD